MNLATSFFEHANRSPEREALVLPAGPVSYAELGAAVRRLAAELELPGESTVLLLAGRSVTSYAGTLAILAAGHAYVPLNIAFPPARNAMIARQSGARTIVVDQEGFLALAPWLGTLDTPLRVVSLDAIGELERGAPHVCEWRHARTTKTGDAFVPTQVAGDAPAYIMFTSGSTGRPKGVVVTHDNVRSYVENFLGTYPIGAEDRLSQTFDFTFDLSVHDQFVAWAAGATLVAYPPAALTAPLEFTRTHRVSVWFSVPSVVAHLEAARRLDELGLPDLRLSLFCGERLSFNAWRLWRRVAPRSRIVNLYGPTETTIAITHFEVPSDFSADFAPDGVIPIGRAFATQRAVVRRADGTPCLPTETGELWLSGSQVSAGYFRDPTLTAERFVRRGDATWYRSGDRATLDGDGLLRFVGRDDGQVKIMGYRVELGDVESSLRAATGSAEAVVVLVARDDLDELCAFLPSAVASRKAEVRRVVAECLPAYMRPRRYLFLDRFPLNANGKIDRAALAEAARS